MALYTSDEHTDLLSRTVDSYRINAEKHVASLLTISDIECRKGIALALHSSISNCLLTIEILKFLYANSDMKDKRMRAKIADLNKTSTVLKDLLAKLSRIALQR